jgi:nicotinamidase-related amidase
MNLLILILTGMIANAQEFRFPPSPTRMTPQYYPIYPSTTWHSINPPGWASAAMLDAVDAPLCSVSDKNSALMVIDVQDYFVLRTKGGLLKENAGKATKLTNEVVKSIEAAKKANLPVILVEYEGAGSTSERVQKALEGYDKVHVIKKNTDGAFDASNRSKKELGEILRKEKIKNIAVTGANGSACVNSTIEGALQSNCSITAVKSAVADFNYKSFIYPYEYTAEIEEAFNNPGGACVDCHFAQVGVADDLNDVFKVQKTNRPTALESDSEGVR